MMPFKRGAPGYSTQDERRVARRQKGSLRATSVQPRTIERYEEACRWFYQLLSHRNLAVPADAVAFDSLVAKAIEDAWEDGETASTIGDLLSGLSHFIPSLKGNLKGSWKLFGVWQRQELPERAWPASIDQCLALAGVLVQQGGQDCALLVLIMFHCILRTDEMFSLRKSQFDFSSVRDRGYLALGSDTKGAQRKGAAEGVSVTWPYLLGVLRTALARLPPNARLLQRGELDFRRRFAAAVATLGLVGRFTPYSLRRGGATRHFQELGSFDLTAERGRWAHVRTARIYINTALAEASQHTQTPRCRAAVAAYTRHLPTEAWTPFQE